MDVSDIQKNIKDRSVEKLTVIVSILVIGSIFSTLPIPTSGTHSAQLMCTQPSTPLYKKKSRGVVQKVISASPGLKFKLLFWFVYIYNFVYFKSFKTKTFIAPEKI